MTDTTRFAGHGVLVTGAARGIGAATARRFAQEGARVLVTDRDGPEAEKTAATLREEGLAAQALACDVGDRASVEAAVAHAADTFGSLDVLVNSAASCTPDTPLFEDGPDEAWARDLDVTLTGTYRCCRAAFSAKSSVLSSIASAAAAPGALAARVNISLLMRSAGARRADTDRAATKGRGAGWTGRCGQAWPRAC